MHGYVEHAIGLDATAVSLDALEPPSLLALLERASFVNGNDQRFTARGKALTEVDARVLRFGSADGAAMYVGWLRAHGTDLLGSLTQGAHAPELPGSVAFSHDPCGSCTKDTFQYFVAWTRGPFVLSVLVGGPNAGPTSAASVTSSLDDTVKLK